MLTRLRPTVFWTPFSLLIAALLFSLIDKTGFSAMMSGINDFILNHFGWLFSATAMCMLLLCCAIFLSPVGKVRIGGPDAVPMLSRWRLFSIVLCTTIATGILFWGVAEPLFHYQSPPDFTGFKPESRASAHFAMSTMYLHWSFMPYAVYSIPALAFALVYYNYGRSFSLGSTLFPLLRKKHPWLHQLLDIIGLFALVAGMSASLGTGILMLSGGLNSLFGLEQGVALYGLIGLSVVASFVISAGTGLLKGIRFLSSLNVIIFFIILGAVFAFGPGFELFGLAWRGLKMHAATFLESSLSGIIYPESDWPKAWTVFYWANWMAWAPITALFLGKISYGYTVRQFFWYYWIIPSLFAIAWMSVFSGTSILFETAGTADLSGALAENGYQAVAYAIFNELPLALPISILFLFSVFTSYVTAADSNTDAMGSISSKGISPDNPESPLLVKILWGGVIGAVAWTMISFAGVDGVRMLSNIGGLPVVFFLLLVAVSLGRMCLELYRKEKQSRPTGGD